MFEPIPIHEFEKRTGLHCARLNTSFSHVERVVSLRSVETIETILVMTEDYLRQLMRRVTLVGDTSKRPYADAEITFITIDPHQLRVVQTFVERKKWTSFIEAFPNKLAGHCLPKGISRVPPLIALGRDAAGDQVMAQYVPPVVEQENGHTNLLDGIHRNFVTLRIGALIETVLIRNVSVPLPAEPHEWGNVHMVEEKPPKDKRFFSLREEFFRDLKYVGVDG